MTYRDVLSPTPPGVMGASAQDLATLMQGMIGTQMDTLSRILRELQRQNPSVKATTIVSNAHQNEITDTLDHEITFEVGGSRGPVYRVIVFSSYDQIVLFNDEPIGNVNDGLRFAATNMAIFPYSGGVMNVHVRAAALSASSLFINGPSDVAHGGFFVYGWTIPIYDRERM